MLERASSRKKLAEKQKHLGLGTQDGPISSELVKLDRANPASCLDGTPPRISRVSALRQAMAHRLCFLSCPENPTRLLSVG